MNCDLILGIDWLHKHNPKINWESNNIQFTCCWSVHDELRFGDAQPLNLVIPIQLGDANLEIPAFDNSIDVAMLSENEFFSQGQITTFGLIYSISSMEKAALHSYIAENLSKGFICNSTSSAASPILFVKKPNGSLQLCVDYQGLNSITKQNCYLLPLVNKLLNSVKGCCVFTKLNLKSAFNLLRIAAGDEWKTTF